MTLDDFMSESLNHLSNSFRMEIPEYIYTVYINVMLCKSNIALMNTRIQILNTKAKIGIITQE